MKILDLWEEGNIMKIRFFLVIGLFLLLSCSVTNKMSKAENLRLVKKLSEDNGNVFCVSSTHIMTSYVWSYSAREVSIYKLRKGRIEKVETYPIKGKDWIIQLTKEDYFELDKCMELDGDLLCILLNDDRKDLPINLQCFVKRGYKSEFLNQLAIDIEKYNMLW